ATEAAISAEIEFIDHRTLGLGSARGIDAYLRGLRSQLEIAADIAIRANDVLALHADAFLVSWTTSGTHAESGGVFENQFLMLRTYDLDGLLRRVEWFDPEDVDVALARFDELTAPQTPAHRVRPNAATALLDRMTAVHAARDLAAFAQLSADDMIVVHHPTRVEFGRDAGLARFESLYRAEDLVIGNELLATLGDSLALSRTSTSVSALADYDVDFGAIRIDTHVVTEVDAHGRHRRVEIFADDHLADAIARLYERYAELLPAGPERERAAMAARAVAAVLPTDFDAIAAVLAPDVEFADRRTLGMGSGRGAERYLRGLCSLFDVARDRIASTDELIAANSNGLLVRRTTGGIAREGGGAFEHHFLMLWVFGADGRLTHIELFDADRDAAALARFDALTTEPPEPRFANAATRAVERYEQCWRDGDLDGVLATFVPTHSMDDRRKLMRWQIAGDDFFANLRMNFAQSVEWQTRLLATRGERLALFHVLKTSDGEAGGVGRAESEFLWLVEVDTDGRRSALVIFDPNDQGAAYTELGARHAAGEAAAFAMVSASMLCASDLVVADHRRLGWETLHGPAGYVGALRALVDLAPDTKMRLDHVTMAEHGFLVVTAWSGTRDGGAFEEPSGMVGELDDAGRLRRLDQYDLERLDEARARFAEISTPAAPDPPRIPPNAATRAGERFRDFALAADWDALRDLCAPIAFEDRRPLVRTSGGCEMIVANTQTIDRSVWERATRTLLATAGDRLALHLNQWRGDEAAGAFEVDALEVTEVDADGRIVAAIVFDP
ncbi:MAG: hypothetical protein NTZ61_10140, partial [Proteobacteria bacterium]|nr:hypothetical protein [Pseudomonadota bacterium]